MIRTAVVLVNWNGWRDTIECLASLVGLVRLPDFIIVVDNASKDGSVERIAAWCRGDLQVEATATPSQVPGIQRRAPPDLRWAAINGGDLMPEHSPTVLLVKSSANGGFASGNNIGIELALSAGADFCWLLNTDTVVDPHALVALQARAAVRPDAGIIGSTLLYYWRPNEVQALGGAMFDPRTGVSHHLGIGSPAAGIPRDPISVEARTDYVVGASMFVSRAFLESVGPMCEDYFLYFEEIDWALRSRGRFALAYAPESRVYHKVGGSSRKTASRASLRYLYRNRLRFISRFFPESLKAARRHLLLQLLQHLRRGHWNDVLEISGALRASAIQLQRNAR